MQCRNCRLRGKSQCDVNHSQSIHFQSIRCETIIHIYWLWCGEKRTNKNVNTFYDGKRENENGTELNVYLLILFIARKGWTNIENEWMNGCEKHIDRPDCKTTLFIYDQFELALFLAEWRTDFNWFWHFQSNPKMKCVNCISASIWCNAVNIHFTSTIWERNARQPHVALAKRGKMKQMLKQKRVNWKWGRHFYAGRQADRPTSHTQPYRQKYEIIHNTLSEHLVWIEQCKTDILWWTPVPLMFDILLELLGSLAVCKDNELEFCESCSKPAAKTQINSHRQLIFVDVKMPLQLSKANVIFERIDRITNLVSVYGHQTNSRTIPSELSKIYQRKVLSVC